MVGRPGPGSSSRRLRKSLRSSTALLSRGERWLLRHPQSWRRRAFFEVDGFFFGGGEEREFLAVVVVSFPISKPTYLALKTAVAAAAAASRRAALRGTSTAAIAGVTAFATEEGLASGIIAIFFQSDKESFCFVLVASQPVLIFFSFLPRPFPFFFRFEIYKGKRKEGDDDPPQQSSLSFSSSSTW